MKKLKSLDDFEEQKNEQTQLHSAVIGEPLTDLLNVMTKTIELTTNSIDEQVKKLPQKTEFRFTISDNLKKVAKIQKNMIDLAQLLTEMSDQMIALKLNFPNMDPGDLVIVNNMKYNIDNMIASLRREKKSGKLTGAIDNSKRLQRNLEHLKKDFLKSQGIK